MTTHPPADERLILSDEAATAALGARLAAALRPGDLVALTGGLGAGKSALARAIVRALIAQPDAIVPSPSYTLVNVYSAPAGEVWHADLYRLGAPSEALELGLVEALPHAILLVEWPERLGAHLPARHLEIALAPLPGSNGAEPREARITARGPGWEPAMTAIGDVR